MGDRQTPSDKPVGDPRDVTVKYYHEGGSWWGTIDGWHWSCAGATLDECRELAREGVPYGVDERLRARSVSFVHVHDQPLVKVRPPAQETFRLYHPEDDT